MNLSVYSLIATNFIFWSHIILATSGYLLRHQVLQYNYELVLIVIHVFYASGGFVTISLFILKIDNVC